jgi:hypothetical protein
MVGNDDRRPARLRARVLAGSVSSLKNDRVDARRLAELLAAGMLPGVWRCDEATRVRRRKVARRTQLVRGRTRAKNQIHAALIRQIEGRTTRTTCSTSTAAPCRRSRRWRATAMKTRSTWSSSAAAPAGASSLSASRDAAGGSWCSSGALSGTPITTGSPTRRLAQDLLDRQAHRRRAGSRRDGQEQLGPRRGRLDGSPRRLRPALPSLRLPNENARRRRRQLALPYEELKRHYELVERELPVPG